MARILMSRIGLGLYLNSNQNIVFAHPLQKDACVNEFRQFIENFRLSGALQDYLVGRNKSAFASQGASQSRGPTGSGWFTASVQQIFVFKRIEIVFQVNASIVSSPDHLIEGDNHFGSNKWVHASHASCKYFPNFWIWISTRIELSSQDKFNAFVEGNEAAIQNAALHILGKLSENLTQQKWGVSTNGQSRHADAANNPTSQGPGELSLTTKNSLLITVTTWDEIKRLHRTEQTRQSVCEANVTCRHPMGDRGKFQITLEGDEQDKESTEKVLGFSIASHLRAVGFVESARRTPVRSSDTRVTNDLALDLALENKVVAHHAVSTTFIDALSRDIRRVNELSNSSEASDSTPEVFLLQEWSGLARDRWPSDEALTESKELTRIRQRCFLEGIQRSFYTVPFSRILTESTQEIRTVTVIGMSPALPITFGPSDPELAIKKLDAGYCILTPNPSFDPNAWINARISEAAHVFRAYDPDFICFPEFAFPPTLILQGAGSTVDGTGFAYQAEADETPESKTPKSKMFSERFSGAFDADDPRPFCFFGTFHCRTTLTNVGVVLPSEFGKDCKYSMETAYGSLSEEIGSKSRKEVFPPFFLTKKFPAKRAGEKVSVPVDGGIEIFESKAGNAVFLICSEALDVNASNAIIRYNKLSFGSRIDYVFVPSFNRSKELLAACQELSLLAGCVVMNVNVDGKYANAFDVTVQLPTSAVYMAGVCISSSKESRLAKTIGIDCKFFSFERVDVLGRNQLNSEQWAKKVHSSEGIDGTEEGRSGYFFVFKFSLANIRSYLNWFMDRGGEVGSGFEEY
jgi:hypothetical protein